MATSAGTGTTGSGADLLVNDQSLRDTLLAQIESIGLVRSEENIIRMVKFILFTSMCSISNT
jgi:hypothetical protein